MFVYFLKLFVFLLFFWGFVSADLLDDAFSTSSDHVADPSVAEDQDWFASFLSWIAEFMLTVAAVLWVTMVLFGWIMFILSFGDESKMAKAKKMLIYIALWLVLALSSYAIIQIIQSVSVWTLS